MVKRNLSMVGSGSGPAAYLAARYSRREELRGYAHDLNERRIQVTSRWLVRGQQIPDNAGRDHVEACRYAREDVADIEAADILVAFMEEPRSALSRGGRHVELGYALAAGKRVLAVGPLEHIFCWLPQLERYDTWPQALRAMEGAVTGRDAGSLTTVIEAVADHYQLAPEQLIGPGREALVVLPRQVAMWLCMRMVSRASLSVVGRAFHRHHTTVLHAVRRVEAAVTTDHRFHQELLSLSRQVDGAGHLAQELREAG